MRKSSYTVASVSAGFFAIAACATSSPGPDTSGGPDGSASSSSGAGSSGGSSGTGASSGSSGAGTADGGASSSSGSSGSSSSGGGNSSSSSSGGTNSDTWLSTPTPPVPGGAQFPFPQDRRTTRCTYPVKISHAQIQGAYTGWLANLVTTTGAGSGERVIDPGSANQTTSEGIAYGMLITVYMADKAHFDKLWAYAQAHMSRGLMSWQIDSSGNAVANGGANSATDADEDMAWALIMADKQWPGGAYLTAAKSLLMNVKSQEISPGNTVNDGNFNGAGSTHPDYASPDYYKVFATVSGDASWNSVTGAEYAQLTGAQNATTGLIPDSVGGSTFGFDACRAPWRVGLDYCWNGSAQAQAFLTKMVAYFNTTSANGATPSNIKIPVSTSGGTGQFNTGAITGPAAIAAMMSASNQTFLNNSWTYLYTLVANAATNPGNLNYFGGTVGLISMLSLSGNFIDYTNPP